MALELGSDLIIMDEAAGRAVAEDLCLQYIGLLGILIKGKQRGRIELIAPLIDRLQSELRFFVSPRIKATVLRSVGE